MLNQPLRVDTAHSHLKKNVCVLSLIEINSGTVGGWKLLPHRISICPTWKEHSLRRGSIDWFATASRNYEMRLLRGEQRVSKGRKKKYIPIPSFRRQAAQVGEQTSSLLFDRREDMARKLDLLFCGSSRSNSLGNRASTNIRKEIERM